MVLSLLSIAAVAALASPVLGDVFRRGVASWIFVVYDLRGETSEGGHTPQCISLSCLAVDCAGQVEIA